MPVTIHLLVLLVSSGGTLILAQSACWLQDCAPIGTLRALGAIGLPVAVLYGVLTLGVVFRLAIALEARHGRTLASLYPSAFLATSISLGFIDARQPNPRGIAELLLSLGLPWFAAALTGLHLRTRQAA